METRSNSEKWIDVCGDDDVGMGKMLSFERGGKWFVVYHLDDGYFATDNVCTHAFALLSDGWLEDGKIECPLHGALFDVKTGAVENGPATCAIKTFPIKHEAGRIMCDVGEILDSL